MFHNMDLKELSELELDVYNYIILHPNQVQKMTIRQLALATETSTATIGRFCNKLKLDGFSELKYLIRDELHQEQQLYTSYDISTPLTDFFTKVSRDEFEQQIKAWLKLVQQARTTVYLGIGSSGYLADYGARFLSNAGGMAFSQTDPFQPLIKANYELEDILVIALSVSGETKETLAWLSDYKRRHAKIVAITNHAHSSLSQLADLTITYYMPDHNQDDHVSMTTQVPVVYLLETIAQRYASALSRLERDK